jgi:hypothetical protein
MNASDAAALHERTKHTWQRLRANSRGLDWGNHPFPFKLYPDLEPLPLPRELPDSRLPATQVLAGHLSPAGAWGAGGVPAGGGDGGGARGRGANRQPAA